MTAGPGLAGRHCRAGSGGCAAPQLDHPGAGALGSASTRSVRSWGERGATVPPSRVRAIAWIASARRAGDTVRMVGGCGSV